MIRAPEKTKHITLHQFILHPQHIRYAALIE